MPSDRSVIRSQVSVSSKARIMAEAFDGLAYDKWRQEQNEEAANDRVEVPEPDVAALRAGRTPAVA
jgi:hypothetical protein